MAEGELVPLDMLILLDRSGSMTTNAKWDLVSDDAHYVDLVDPEILRSARTVPSSGFVAAAIRLWRSPHAAEKALT